MTKQKQIFDTIYKYETRDSLQITDTLISIKQMKTNDKMKQGQKR